MRQLSIILIFLCGNAAHAAEFSTDLQQITFGPKNHFFGYIGHGMTIPWNGSGRFIVSLRTDFHERMPMPGEAADIVLIDTKDKHKVIPVDRTLAWNLQQGSMLYWHPLFPDTQFFYNDLDPKTGVVFTVLFDIEKRQRVREFRFGKHSIANGGVAPNGKYFAGINYGRISASRSVISYAGAFDDLADGPANPETEGIFLVDTTTGEKKLIVPYRKLAEKLLDTPRNKELLGGSEKYPIYAHHTLWSRDSERLLFVVRGKKNKRPSTGCVVKADGTGLAVVPFAGHPEWLDERKIVIASKEGGAYNLYDVIDRKFSGQLGKTGVFPDTDDDNALSPDSRWFVGSQKTKANECTYTIYRLADGLWFRSPPVPTRSGGGDCRIDPAPRWNRSSDALLVPGVATDGTVQLFTLTIKAK